ncbi:unnamed protein product [Candidula unifasciata]|uniref:WSC domain-containing protein n=1 Tax=Candidula unifasciata TaxID=100452 RepID=A0A8S3ZDZ1_9EUPU|nr:unnamed protein product [Candidula unifasciata]
MCDVTSKLLYNVLTGLNLCARRLHGKAGRSAYIACFMQQKSWNDKSVIKVNLWSSTTVNACISKCWDHRQRFAVLLNGDQCWCINIIRGLTEIEEAQCSTPCNGNRSQVCGGGNRYSIYYTGYIEEPQYTHLTHKDINTAFQGCYINNNYRDKCTVEIATQRMSVPMCMDLCECSSYQYASVSKKSRCCCDANMTLYRQAGLGSCRIKCPFTGSDYYCGDTSSEHFAVYRTGWRRTTKRTQLYQQLMWRGRCSEIQKNHCNRYKENKKNKNILLKSSKPLKNNSFMFCVCVCVSENSLFMFCVWCVCVCE